ncbi:hypothetical protein CLAIMM_06200 [Cladophialophora immunda]|nr:hypothetical protein CLAIMM_06200 [Cladophialophora immunda]
MRKYPRTRLNRLIRAVEARLGRRRCFFSEGQPRDQKKESQFGVSRLYAIYEVEHWPGAFAQFDWTQFVMANIERDALRNEYGRSMKPALPTLPASAVPIYQEMLRQESSDSARIEVNSGQIAGVIFKGQIRTFPEEDIPTQARRDDPDQQHELVRASFMPQLSTSPNMRDALSELSSEQLEELVRNDQMFRDACQFHQTVVHKELRQMNRFYLRCVGRQPGMHLLTWQEVMHEARAMIKLTFLQQLDKWRRQQPDVQFDVQDLTGTIVDLQLRYLISRVRHHDPIPPHAPPRSQRELHRKHQIAAMLRQRHILREWTAAVATRSTVRDGERYRREGEHIMDMWTGTVEEVEAFDERNRRENTALTADMIPMATPLRVHAPLADVHTQTEGREQQQQQQHPPVSSEPPLQLPGEDQAQIPIQGREQQSQMQPQGQDQAQEGPGVEKAETGTQERGADNASRQEPPQEDSLQMATPVCEQCPEQIHAQTQDQPLAPR